jgi:putative ABC transport system substrate-binding protein
MRKRIQWTRALRQGLRDLGWIEERSVQIDSRWIAGEIDRARAVAKELVGSRPDVLFAGNTPSVAALMGETREIPIVFANLNDPVGSGVVASLARPGGNATGFAAFEYSLGSKWL